MPTQFFFFFFWGVGTLGEMANLQNVELTKTPTITTKNDQKAQVDFLEVDNF
jgi:hypothetical protein